MSTGYDHINFLSALFDGPSDFGAAFDCTSVNSDLIYPLSIERYALVGEKRAPAQYRQRWVVILEQPFCACVTDLFANTVMSAIFHRHLDVLRNEYDSI